MIAFDDAVLRGPGDGEVELLSVAEIFFQISPAPPQAFLVPCLFQGVEVGIGRNLDGEPNRAYFQGLAGLHVFKGAVAFFQDGDGPAHEVFAWRRGRRRRCRPRGGFRGCRRSAGR